MNAKIYKRIMFHTFVTLLSSYYDPSLFRIVTSIVFLVLSVHTTKYILRVCYQKNDDENEIENSCYYLRALFGACFENIGWNELQYCTS